MKKDSYSVCIVDDSTVDVFITKSVLQQIPAISKVYVFNDPEAALEFLEEESKMNRMFPDIILLDIMMPVIDGFEWIDEVNDLFAEEFIPKIFMLSHSDMKRDFESFKKQRLSKVLLKKPLDKEIFLKHLEEQFAESDTENIITNPPRL
ncbi:MAG: CheY-like chemotaxis protein [Arenicella sp.]|jgi:CheY-like chemotaxis protein